MRAPKLAVLVALALLLALAIAPAPWHLPIGAAGWLGLRWAVPDVHRTTGRLRRWLQALAVLCLLGAAFGPVDHHIHTAGVSAAGALSGVTMVVRAFAIVALTSIASSALPIRRWAGRVRSPAARRVIEVVVVATNLVPVLLRALSTASSTLSERRPGLLQLPRRLWLLAVHSSLRTAMLAENVAFDMAIAAHNIDPGGEEPG